MRASGALLVAALAAVLAAAVPAAAAAGDFTVTKAVRRVDATKHVLSTATSWKVKGKGTAFLVPFPADEAAQLASVTAENEASKEKLTVRKAPEADKCVATARSSQPAVRQLGQATGLPHRGAP